MVLLPAVTNGPPPTAGVFVVAAGRGTVEVDGSDTEPCVVIVVGVEEGLVVVVSEVDDTVVEDSEKFAVKKASGFSAQ